jgi:hypothetical protein
MSDWGSTIDLLGMRRQRRENMLDRLTGAGQQIGQNIFTGRENERQRGFEAEQADTQRGFLSGENELDRAQRLREIEASEEQNRLTQELLQQYNLDTIGAQAAAEEGLIGARAEAESGLQRERHLQTLEEMDDDQLHQIEMVRQQLDADRELIDYDRAQYENGSYSASDGTPFRWNDAPTYQAAMTSLSAYENRLTALAARSAAENSSDRVWSIYREMKDAAESDLWRWDEEQGEYIRTDRSTDYILENFRTQVAMTQLSDETKQAMIDAFELWLTYADTNPPGDPSEGDVNVTSTTGWWNGLPPEDQARIESLPEATDVPSLATRTATNLDAIIGQEGMNSPAGRQALLAQSNPGLGLLQLFDNSAPEPSVDTTEQDVWDRLQRFAATLSPSDRAQMQEVARYATEIGKQGTTDLLGEIESFLRRAGF